MGKYWINASPFSDLQEAIPDGVTVVDFWPALAAPAVLTRTLVWWDARWFTQVINNGGTRTPLNWDFTILMAENDTGEAPPPGPADPVMQGLITAVGPASTFPPSDEFADVFQAWLGSSGAHPMDSKAKRAAVNYSGGMLPQLRFGTIMGHENAEGWWWDGPWSLYLKIAMLIDDPSF